MLYSGKLQWRWKSYGSPAAIFIYHCTRHIHTHTHLQPFIATINLNRHIVVYNESINDTCISAIFHVHIYLQLICIYRIFAFIFLNLTSSSSSCISLDWEGRHFQSISTAKNHWSSMPWGSCKACGKTLWGLKASLFPIGNWIIRLLMQHKPKNQILGFSFFLIVPWILTKSRKPILSNSIADNWCGFPSRDSITQTSPPPSSQKIPR